MLSKCSSKNLLTINTTKISQMSKNVHPTHGFTLPSNTQNSLVSNRVDVNMIVEPMIDLSIEARHNYMYVRFVAHSDMVVAIPNKFLGLYQEF